jgi:hypothetical protein
MGSVAGEITSGGLLSLPRIVGNVFLTISLVFILGGCVALSHLADSSSQTSTPAPPLLDRQKSVFVAMPEDGGSASSWYIGSGRVVAHTVAGAFSRRGVPVYLPERRVENSEVVAAALRWKADYAVRSTITRWDQRNRLLGRPSRLTIGVSVIDVATARVISSASIEGFSYLAPATLPAPEELLAGPLSQYLDMLY